MNKILVLHVVGLIFISGLTGCSLLESKKQAETVEAIGFIKGEIRYKGPQRGPIIVVVMRQEKGVIVRANKKIVDENGQYKFGLLPGSYFVAAFVDNNNNNHHDTGEHGKIDLETSSLTVTSKKEIKVSPIVITGTPGMLPDKSKIALVESAITKNIGKVISLSDPMFTQDNYNEGMWRPLDFIKKGRGGFFFLEPYDKKKIPVIFIHGINGGPTDFTKLIDKLDHKRYQAWILYYPTGLRLNMVSEFLVKSVADMQTRYRIKEFVVVAHSMGGLVSRSFMKKYYERHPKKAKAIKVYMTINSPMLGISALSGMESYPLLVSVWLDLPPNSKFIQGIHSWTIPRTTKYYLFFSYLEDEDDDGVVAIHSQLPYNLQKEARRIYGFNTNHVGPLNEDKLINIISGVIQQKR